MSAANPIGTRLDSHEPFASYRARTQALVSSSLRGAVDRLSSDEERGGDRLSGPTDAGLASTST